MTDRGLPLVDGAPACPFVALEDDRDARATAPDHRHRCYAEIRPAPRALAHQEAYCLSSAFPVCPTFQDWARREAAQARAAAASADADDAPAPDRTAPSAPPPGSWPADPAPEGPGSSQRNPPRSWAAPPPWLSSRDGAPEDDEPDVEIQPPVRGGGLAGSFADRLAGGSAGRPQPGPTDHPPAPVERRKAQAGDDDDAEAEGHDRWAGTSRSRRPDRDDRAPAAPALPGPSWERPRRLEAYPTLKTRIGLPSLSLPPMLVGVAALVLAAVALFFLPTILGLFGDQTGTGGSPTPSVPASGAPSGSPAEPTPTPAPTQLIYRVQEGDTMSKIADRFGVPLSALIEANRETVPNPDLLQIGQEVIIPVAAPTTLPGVSPSPSPTPAS
ncbi:MAG: hypothetical protein A2V84_13125 [Chloroflexi bacterium RBG_16_70_13]|nr:MAG: hypothetical protein A2V84_13125 [Chloroflexi bacterium RBG_16_70_13]